MIRKLVIRDFAVVSEAALEFGPGLTVLTGETGAGKSILVEALSFAIGARGSTDWIRAGADRLEVRATFDGKLAAPEGLGPGPWEVVREIDDKGKSRARVNGRPVAAAQLAQLGDLLVDFHGQHEHQTLFKPAEQLDLLDRYAGLEPLREKLARAWSELKELEARAAGLELSEDERLRRIDLLRYQVDEIDRVGPKPGEEAELEAALPRLKNAERLGRLAGELHASLREEEGAACEDLAKAERAASEMASADPEAAELERMVREARTIAEEAASRASEYLSRLESDPSRLDEILGRQDKLDRLKKKYGPGLGDVLAHREKAAAELAGLENRDEELAVVEKKAAEARRSLERLCGEAHEERTSAAKKLSAKVQKELSELGMPGAKVSAAVEEEEGYLSPSGSDRVEFLIAPNPGEGLKPLRAIASGGELSRTMLALKTVLTAADRVPTLVFDEVDAGVGGMVASAVGRRLKLLARARQVLVITHLPQVACFGDEHLHVSKAVASGRTSALVERLAEAPRLEEMARLLGGRKATAASLQHARELLEAARKDAAAAFPPNTR